MFTQGNNNKPVSDQTIRDCLKKAGMRAVVKKKKLKLNPKQKKDRLEFAIRHQHWTMDDWMHVIWSDESKINRIGSDERKWVWKKQGEGLSSRLVKGTQKFGGGNIMMWGCFGWDGVGYATKIDGRMDAELYVSILEDELQDSLD